MGLDSTLTIVTKTNEEIEIYFRKANAIHNWFVKNTQGGIDDCRIQKVPKEKLLEFYETISKILSRNGLQRDLLAENLLPTTSGFFFGETDYDEWYYSKLEDAVEFLKPLIETDNILSAEYHSSW